MTIDFEPFDADNHYYETTDAFTRFLSSDMAKRCMQWAQLDGRQRLLVAGKINRFIPNPTFDPIAQPGSLYSFYRGKAGGDIKAAFGALDAIADHPEYQHRDARLIAMDEQHLAGCIMLPTLGVGMEEALKDDPLAAMAAFRSFNRWLHEHWGYNTEDRIYAAPYMTLADPDAAANELQWVIEQGARVVVMRASPPPVTGRPRSFGDPAYHRFWATAADAGVVVVFHSGDVGTGFFAERWGDVGEHESFNISPLYSVVSVDRAVFDAIAVLVCHGVFAQHPRLKIATIESGSEWLPLLFKRLDKAFKSHGKQFVEHPHTTLRRQLWVSPHFEEDKRVAADLLGVERVLMGSDWPHAEGLAQPCDYEAELRHDGFTDDEIRLVMRDNALAMLSG
jgi:predicted TIM-barrel fold metal-dependent hydrolase